MRLSIVLSLLVLFLFAVPATPSAATGDGDKQLDDEPGISGRTWSARGGIGPEGPVLADRGIRLPSTRIVNRVIDLLDEEVELSSEAGSNTWESKIIYTSQFNRIGLRFSSAAEAAWISCRVAWRFSNGEEFQGSIPMITAAPLNPPQELPDGIADPSLRQSYPFYSPQLDYTEVRGLQARVQCWLAQVRVGDFGRLGDDPPLTDPDPTDPIPVTGSLTDVKVLLRRE